MNATEIAPLTEEAVTRLLAERAARVSGPSDDSRRRVKRWPFPSTAELWLPQRDGTERYLLATSVNLSLHGVGIRCDEPLSPGRTVGVAIHEPEVSLHGRAVVRHCTQIEQEYLIGLQFVFDRASSPAAHGHADDTSRNGRMGRRGSGNVRPRRAPASGRMTYPREFLPRR